MSYALRAIDAFLRHFHLDLQLQRLDSIVLLAIGLASCLWFPGRFPCLAMASGHLCSKQTEATKNVL